MEGLLFSIRIYPQLKNMPTKGLSILKVKGLDFCRQLLFLQLVKLGTRTIKRPKNPREHLSSKLTLAVSLTHLIANLSDPEAMPVFLEGGWLCLDYRIFCFRRIREEAFWKGIIFSGGAKGIHIHTPL